MCWRGHKTLHNPIQSLQFFVADYYYLLLLFLLEFKNTAYLSLKGNSHFKPLVTTTRSTNPPWFCSDHGATRIILLIYLFCCRWLCCVCVLCQTSVISVTLNGEKRKLKMDDGTSEQVDCLSNADAYVPSVDLSTDVVAVLQQCQVDY